MLGPTLAGSDHLGVAPGPAVIPAVAQEDLGPVGLLAATLVLPDNPDVVTACGDGREPGRRRVRREVDRVRRTIGPLVEHMAAAVDMLLGDDVDCLPRRGDIRETAEPAGIGESRPGRHRIVRDLRARKRNLRSGHRRTAAGGDEDGRRDGEQLVGDRHRVRDRRGARDEVLQIREAGR